MFKLILTAVVEVAFLVRTILNLHPKNPSPDHIGPPKKNVRKTK